MYLQPLHTIIFILKVHGKCLANKRTSIVHTPILLAVLGGQTPTYLSETTLHTLLL